MNTQRPDRAAVKFRFPAVIAAAPLMLMLVGCGESARGKDLDSPGPQVIARGVEGPACGRATSQVLASAAGHVAEQIYAHELSRPGVHADRSQVEGNAPLLDALSKGDRAAVRSAVTRLVFSHTHIVRLRVTRRNTVLADVGGPYVLAPVGGELRLHGRLIGRYLLSVQDDLGYVKLETRYIGAPVMLNAGPQRVPLQGTFAMAAAKIPENGLVSYRNTSYESLSFRAKAFPMGTVRIELLVPVARRRSVRSCNEVRAFELARIARRVWRRFVLASAPPSAYAKSISDLTGARIYVRSGARPVAGSDRTGPPSLPHTGTIGYHGVAYGVSSFATSAGGESLRIFLLLPDTAQSGN